MINSSWLLIVLVLVVVVIVIYISMTPSLVVREKFENGSINNSTNNPINNHTNNPTNNSNTNQYQKQCRMPTDANPFMNLTVYEIQNGDNNSACKDVDINDLTKTKLNNNYSQRSFYTMPVTSNPNNQTGFAKWLYSSPPTCKEDSAYCLKYEDIRFSKYNPEIDSPEIINQNDDENRNNT